jgi:tetratricopeptide (TPR) repeat protein
MCLDPVQGDKYPVSRLRDLFAELRRRRVLRAAGYYAAAGWLLIQVTTTITPLTTLPERTPQVVLWLVLAGFPVALVLAWFFQIGPTGTSREVVLGSEAPARRWTSRVQGRLAVGAPWVILALVAGGFLARSAAPAPGLVQRGTLPDRVQILVADLYSPDDPGLGGVAAEWLRVQLEQSPFVRVLGGEEIGAALARMERDPSLPLDEPTALEIAIRDGVPAVLVGEVTLMGEGYALTARLLASADNSVLARFAVRSDRADDFLDAIDGLAHQVLRRTGESAASLRRLPALGSVTTSSLEALRAFTAAEQAHLREDDPEAAIPLYERAIELDSTFAIAHRRLYLLLAQLRRDPERQRRLLLQAYAHRDKLTPYERLFVEERAPYLTTDLDSAASTFERVWHAHERYARLYPEDTRAYGNRSSWLQVFGRYAEAEQLAREATELGQDGFLMYGNLVQAQLSQGKLDEARRTLDAWLERWGPSPTSHRWNVTLAIVRGDTAEAESTVAAAFAEGHAVRNQPGPHVQLGLMWAARGQLTRAESLLQPVQRRQIETGGAYAGLQAVANRAAMLAALTRDTVQAMDTVFAAMDRWPLESLSPEQLNDPLHALGMVFVLFGDTAQASAIMRAIESPEPPRFSGMHASGRNNIIQGILARREGRYGDAIDRLRRVHAHIEPDAWPELARAWTGLGRPDSAVALYERYLTSSLPRARSLDHLYLADVLEGLAEAHAFQGSRSRAAACYRWFAELWTNADEPLQPRVHEVRYRASRLDGLEAFADSGDWRRSCLDHSPEGN